MITNGEIYKHIIESKDSNNKPMYSSELKEKIEQLGEYCLDNLKNDTYDPLMMLGRIQSGKTRAFIGLISLCFDNGFDLVIVLSKCSKALIEQTVKRMDSTFGNLKNPAGLNLVVAQDIMNIQYKKDDFAVKKQAVAAFLNQNKRSKRIIMVKKENDNLERLNLLIEAIIINNKVKNVLIIDDEADITGIGYEKCDKDITLRSVSGAINNVKKKMTANNLECHTRHVCVMVTATPYSLYLQPAQFSNSSIIPVRPTKTVVLPAGDGYIGMDYYFDASQDETNPCYAKAKYLPYIVSDDEMDLVNGNKKRAKRSDAKKKLGKNDKLSPMLKYVKVDCWLDDTKFQLCSLRKWLLDLLVGTAFIQLTDDCLGYQVSAVVHAHQEQIIHELEAGVIKDLLENIKKVMKYDNDNIKFNRLLHDSYEDIMESVKAYGVLKESSYDDIKHMIYHDNEDDESILDDYAITIINCDNDIKINLNPNTGELRLYNTLTIFVGGSMLDRGITIPNMMSFWYGRSPQIQQMDTVVQHCRMLGYRSNILLSVTRYYTSKKIFEGMREITIRDRILRERLEKNIADDVVYMEGGAKIKPCSPQKIAASKLCNIMPERRYLPIGFNVRASSVAKKKGMEIDKWLLDNNINPGNAYNNFHKGDCVDDKYATISYDDALFLIKKCYEAIDRDKKDGDRFIDFNKFENIFAYSIMNQTENFSSEIALIVRTNRKLRKYKNIKGEKMVQDAPEDGNNEGALAQLLRKKMPVLLMLEEKNEEWGSRFWWPVYYTPEKMSVGIYAEKAAKGKVIAPAAPIPMEIKAFNVTDSNGLLGDANKVEFENKVNSIVDYYNNNYFRAEIDSMGRRGIDCNIVIESDYNGFDIEIIIKWITDKKEIFKNAFNSTSLCNDTELANDTDKFLKMMLDLSISKEANDLKNSIIDRLNQLAENSKLVKTLSECISEIFERVLDIKSVLGSCTNLSNNLCEITLYYDRIVNFSDNEDEIMSLLSMVAAHEMAHAWHYADIMTASGKWGHFDDRYLYVIKYIREVIAEYFVVKVMDNTDIFNSDGAKDKYRKTMSCNDVISSLSDDDFKEIYEKSLSNDVAIINKLGFFD